MPVKYQLVPEKTAMLVVDMQNSFVQEGAIAEIPRARAMVPHLNKLSDVCRLHKIAVIFVRHVLQGGDIDAGRLADLFDAVRDSRMNIAGTSEVEIYPDLELVADW